MEKWKWFVQLTNDSEDLGFIDCFAKYLKLN